jgi:hypothetical protein
MIGAKINNEMLLREMDVYRVLQYAGSQYVKTNGNYVTIKFAINYEGNGLDVKYGMYTPIPVLFNQFSRSYECRNELESTVYLYEIELGYPIRLYPSLIISETYNITHISNGGSFGEAFGLEIFIHNEENMLMNNGYEQRYFSHFHKRSLPIAPLPMSYLL